MLCYEISLVLSVNPSARRYLMTVDSIQVILHVHHARQPARVDQLVSLLDPKKGTVLRQRPRHLTANQSAIVVVRYVFFTREGSLWSRWYIGSY